MTAEILELEHPFSADPIRLIDKPVYTHATWHVKAGRGGEFLDAWNRLADIFKSHDRPPIELTLIRRVDEPTLFQSIGRWRTLADAQSVSENLAAIDAIATLTELCDEGMPAVYEVIRRVTPE